MQLIELSGQSLKASQLVIINHLGNPMVNIAFCIRKEDYKSFVLRNCSSVILSDVIEMVIENLIEMLLRSLSFSFLRTDL